MSENQKWFNQVLLTFKDKNYSTDGYLRLSLISSTEDYLSFNPPCINISISNNHQKSLTLNIQNAEDLIESFDQAIKQLNGTDVVIEKKYNSQTKLYFRFAIDPNQNERVVVIELISNESDMTRIIVPIKPTFQSFLRRLRKYIESYDQLCFSLFNNSINGEAQQIIKQLPNLIKGISAQIVSTDTFLDSRAPVIDSSEYEGTEETIKDLDKFLGDDMSNIKIPEIEEKKIEKEQPLVEVKSDLIEKILEFELVNLENKLASFSVNKNPLIDIANEFNSVIKKYNVTDGMKDNEKMSLSYISSCFYNFCNKNYTINNAAIPQKLPTMKFYGAKNIENIEFAKDILTIIGFVRIMRRRLETKFEDAYTSKAIFWLQLRCFMDPMCFSFLDKLSEDEIISSVVMRYKYFDSLGVFNTYKQMLKDNNCSEIELSDITGFAKEISEKINQGEANVTELHKNLYENGTLRIPTENNFTLEQITNEIVFVEVNEKMGMNFKDENKIKYLKDNGVSDVILNHFTKSEKIQKITKIERITPLQKFIDKFKQDIPESFRDEVIQYVKNLGFNKFEFDKVNWPVDEFDENVIKALANWDPETDPKIKTNFEYFASTVINDSRTKDSILIVSKEEQTKSSWDEISFE